MIGVAPSWLLQGKEPRLNPESQRTGEPVYRTLQIQGASTKGIKEGAQKYSPTNATGTAVKMIPLLSWAQAGIATSFDEIPEDWQEMIPAAVSDNQAFAIQLRGDSMEPRYQDGDVAIVLPNSPPRNGDLVIAKIKEEGFAFKILTLTGGDPAHIKLTSYNPAFPPMEFPREKFHWIYPVHSVNKIIRR